MGSKHGKSFYMKYFKLPHPLPGIRLLKWKGSQQPLMFRTVKYPGSLCLACIPPALTIPASITSWQCPHVLLRRSPAREPAFPSQKFEFPLKFMSEGLFLAEALFSLFLYLVLLALSFPKARSLPCSVTQGKHFIFSSPEWGGQTVRLPSHSNILKMFSLSYLPHASQSAFLRCAWPLKIKLASHSAHLQKMSLNRNRKWKPFLQT